MSTASIVREFILNMTEVLDARQAHNLFEQANPGVINYGNFNWYYKKLRPDAPESAPKASTTTSSATIDDDDDKVDMEFVDQPMYETEKSLDPRILVPLKTGTSFDTLASKRGGLSRNTVIMVTGESGAGKTTICTNLAEYVKENNENVTAGFISGEMDETDWFEECVDNPSLKNLNVVYLLNYVEAKNFMDILYTALTRYDLCILDSIESVLDIIKDVTGYSTKKAERALIDLMRKAAKEKCSTILAIQQYTKGGSYVGSTKLKHMTTGLIYVRFDKSGGRYIEFDKNRRCGAMIKKRLYYKKDKATGRLIFDTKRFEDQRSLDNMSANMSEDIQAQSDKFDSLLNELANQTGATSTDTDNSSMELSANQSVA